MATIVCPSCSAQYRISDEKITEKSRLRCKKCGTVFRLHDTLQERGDSSPPPEDTPPKQAESSSEAPTLDFDLSAIQLQTPSAPQEAESEPTSDQEDLSLDMNLGDLTLDFGASSEPSSEEETSDFGASSDSSSEGETLDFGASYEASEGETLSFGGASRLDAKTEGETELEDHITEMTVDQPDSADFSGFSFESDNQQEESSDALDDSLDFSFSADIPEESDEEEGEGFGEGEGEFGEMPAEAQAFSDESQDLGLSLGDMNLETPAEDRSALPDEEAGLPLSSEEDEMPPLTGAEPPATEEEAIPGTELANCCIDSLAMGLSQCEICGRDLKDYQQYARELQQQRREQLREELVKAEVQIGFSEESAEADRGKEHASSTEDFTDVERALDALADGTFQESIKKKEAKKTRTKTLKMFVAVLVLAVAAVGGGMWYFLPSSHEKLMAHYHEVIAQEEVDPTALVRLFLDAAIEKDQEIFQKLSIIQGIPEITEGRILGASDNVEKTSIGKPGQAVVQLNEDIAALEKQINEKTRLLNEYSSKTFSPAALEQSIQSLEQKFEELTAEFEVKDAELARKLMSLRKELQETQESIAKNKALSRKYLDATDTVGKALYTNSVTQLRALGEQQAQLEAQIQQENAEYQQKRQTLQNEYAPQFAELEERLSEARAMLKEANLLQDRERSPVVILSRELEQMTAEIIEKKERLEQAEQQLAEALRFFQQPEQQNRIVNEQQAAEFSFVERNVAVMLKAGTSSEQQVSVILKRYEAVLSGATLQSNWLVEKIAK